jgi:hypothetical protein
VGGNHGTRENGEKSTTRSVKFLRVDANEKVQHIHRLKFTIASYLTRHTRAETTFFVEPFL